MKRSTSNKIKSEIPAHCRRVRQKLVEHLDHQLRQQEQQAVDEHLKVCPRCSAERVALKRTLSLLGQRNLPDPGDAFWTALRYRVHRGVKKARTVPSRRPPIPARALVPSVAFASLLVFFFLWWSSPPQPPAPGQQPLLAQVEQQGLRDLEKLGESQLNVEDLPWALTPGDSLVELLAAIPRPAETLERVLVRKKMAENPDLWESVVEEKFASELSLETMLEDLTEEQLKELSIRLKNIMG